MKIILIFCLIFLISCESTSIADEMLINREQFIQAITGDKVWVLYTAESNGLNVKDSCFLNEKYEFKENGDVLILQFNKNCKIDSIKSNWNYENSIFSFTYRHYSKDNQDESWSRFYTIFAKISKFDSTAFELSTSNSKAIFKRIN